METRETEILIGSLHRLTELLDSLHKDVECLNRSASGTDHEAEDTAIPCDAKRKKMRSSGQLLRACWPSSAEHTAWHHEFIKAGVSAALVVLN